ncbi:MAG: bifunctional 4-hydroxy-2-oxoglutarate aldolase/2-dehydro-3-deoxy-phosphogluconate aldolase [Alkalispirochaeta sp.]
MWSQEILNSLEKSKIVAVVVLDREQDAVFTARALVRGGITHMEPTLRTEEAPAALQAIVREVPEMTVGAGTVLTTDQVNLVKQIGAQFAVAPGFNPAVVAAAEAVGLPFAPGVATPSEIEGAYGRGCTVLKLFPATPLGGPSYLKSVNAAYRHLRLRFIPTGGVTENTMVDWLSVPEVLAVGGSWLAPADLIHAGDWDEIERRATSAVDRIAAG